MRILVNGPTGEKRARTVLDKLKLDWNRINFWRVPTNRVWTRDYGPIFVEPLSNPFGFTLTVVDLHFNGWAKYPDHQRDAKVSRRVARLLPPQTRPFLPNEPNQPCDSAASGPPEARRRSDSASRGPSRSPC